MQNLLLVGFLAKTILEIKTATKNDDGNHLTFEAPTISSLSRSQMDAIPKSIKRSESINKKEQTIPLQKYSSQVDLIHESGNRMSKSQNVRMTPSASTSSIPAKVRKFQSFKSSFFTINFLGLQRI